MTQSAFIQTDIELKLEVDAKLATNKATQQAIKEAKKRQGLVKTKNANDLFDQLDI